MGNNATIAIQNATRSASPVFRHEGTWLSLQDTATERRFDMPYRPTYDFGADFIDGYHQYLANAPMFPPQVADKMIDLGFEGWLLPADACKLYELAYFNPDVLELGTYRGLSSAVMSQAITNSGEKGSIVTVDLDPGHQQIAREAHERLRVPNRQNVHFFHFDGTIFVRNLHQRPDPRRFSLVFVDHTHAYEPMVDVCPMLHEVTQPGGFVLFHDYNDPRNAGSDPNFGVYQAVDGYLSKKEFDFYGVFGCCGLFRRRQTVTTGV
jgi:predicted O-methyltransferase YrrM